MKWTFWEIGQVVQATNDYRSWPDFGIDSVTFDARKVEGAGLFVPLQGQRDGHEFVGQAEENGAVATFWGQDTLQAKPANLPYLEVKDPLAAMQQLAESYRFKVNPKVIAVTGSNGKTTTKDMLAAVASTTYRTYKTQGNYNNHIGVPATILGMPEATEVLVLEMGMDHAGEIYQLSKMAHPDIAAITMIGESHIEHLGSRAGIARAKMEIVAGLAATGVLIVPGDEPLIAPLLEAVSQDIQTFGAAGTTWEPVSIVETAHSVSFSVPHFGEQRFELPFLGQYNARNACIALQVGERLGIPVVTMAQGLQEMRLTQNRTEWLVAANGADLLSDVYNANPTAMRLVLKSFSSLKTAGPKKVVLGDMLDLGEQTAEMHTSIVPDLVAGDFAVIYLYGTEMSQLAPQVRKAGYQGRVVVFAQAEKAQLIATLLTEVDATDTVFLKASNGLGLKEVVTALVAGK